MAITAERTLAILQTHGVDAVFRAHATSVYDPATGQTTHTGTADHPHRIVPPYKSGGTAAERFGGVDGVVTAEAFSAVSPSGMTIVPAVGMDLVYDGKTWTITGVNPIRNNMGVVLYELALQGKAG